MWADAKAPPGTARTERHRAVPNLLHVVEHFMEAPPATLGGARHPRLTGAPEQLRIVLHARVGRVPPEVLRNTHPRIDDGKPNASVETTGSPAVALGDDQGAHLAHTVSGRIVDQLPEDVEGAPRRRADTDGDVRPGCRHQVIP